MRIHRYILLAVLIISAATAAVAHPLGNFSVNQFSRIEIEKGSVRVRQILDMAEIPTFQAAEQIDADKNGSYSDLELETYRAFTDDKRTAGRVNPEKYERSDAAGSRRVADAQDQMGIGRRIHAGRKLEPRCVHQQQLPRTARMA